MARNEHFQQRSASARAAEAEAAASGPGEPEAGASPDVKAGEQAEDAPSDIASESPEASSPGKPHSRSARSPQKKRRVWLRVLFVVVGLILAACLAFAGLFAWNRWWRYDDVADFQGTWYAAGTTTPLTVTADALVFKPDLSYGYTIDTQAKTIRYTLADLEGEGRYWFDYDRHALVIVDGKDFTAQSTAIDDLKRLLDRWWAQISGRETHLPEGEGVIVLMREPDPDALAAEAAAAAAAAEAERKAAEDAVKQANAELEASGEAPAAAPAGESAETPSGESAEAPAGDSSGEPAEAPAGETSSGEAPAGGTSSEASEPKKQDFANESVGVFD